MNKFLQLPADKRRTIYEQVGLRMGIDDPKAIEKDVWVTGILQTVFTLPYADKLVFKGGSSLSKIWNLILRFSEDIDLAIDRSIFGMEGDLTKKQLKKLRKASSLFVKDVFTVDLQRAIHDNGLADYCTITADPNGEGDATIRNPVRSIFLMNRCLETPPPIIYSPRSCWKSGRDPCLNRRPRPKSSH